jgi:hypothetical protein
VRERWNGLPRMPRERHIGKGGRVRRGGECGMTNDEFPLGGGRNLKSRLSLRRRGAFLSLFLFLLFLNPKSEMGIGYLPQPAGQLIVRSPKAMHF